MPFSNLPADEVLMEQALAQAIKNTLDSVQGVGKVHVVPIYPQTDEEDIELTTTDDPVTGPTDPRTDVITIGIPTVRETQYTQDTKTQLIFTYPITYEHQVVASWAKPGYEFTSSAQKVKAVYMRARKALKFNRQLGYNNVVHNYLQQVVTGDEGDAETGGLWHSAEWSLEIIVSDVGV